MKKRLFSIWFALFAILIVLCMATSELKSIHRTLGNIIHKVDNSNIVEEIKD